MQVNGHANLSRLKPDFFTLLSLSEKLLPFVNCVSKGRTRIECMNSLLNHLIERKSRFITPYQHDNLFGACTNPNKNK